MLAASTDLRSGRGTLVNPAQPQSRHGILRRGQRRRAITHNMIVNQFKGETFKNNVLPFLSGENILRRPPCSTCPLPERRRGLGVRSGRFQPIRAADPHVDGSCHNRRANHNASAERGAGGTSGVGEKKSKGTVLSSVWKTSAREIHDIHLFISLIYRCRTC